MVFLKENLEIMQLDEVPDIDTLQKTFNRLIKLYHPDRNINRQEWAHENSQRLIKAFQDLRNSIQSGTIKPRTSLHKQSYSPDIKFYSNHSVHTSESDRPYEGATVSSDRKYLFQLLSGENGGYALPLENIVRILAFSDPSVKKGLLGYYCKFDEVIFPVISLTGQKLFIKSSDLIILFKIGGLPGIGIHIPGNYKFLEVKSIHQSEFVKHNPQEFDSNGWIMHENFPYFYPGTHIMSAIKKLATGS